MARLELTLLGSFMGILDGQPITAAFKSNKVRALLAYLAAEAGQPQHREALAALLWPDWPQQSAMSNLRYALVDLRKNIGDRDAQPPFLLISRDSLQLNLASDARVDTAEFEQFALSTQHSAISSLPNGVGAQSTISNLKSAIALYRGPFLEGFSLADSAPFEDWLAATREHFNRQMVQALHQLGEYYEGRREYELALPYAYRQVELDPWREEAHQQIMRLLARSGQRSAALEQYEACRRMLKDELGVEPGADTLRLYESIRDGKLEIGATEMEPGELPPALGIPPFKGLHYFDEADASLFFGRQALTARLVEHVSEMVACAHHADDPEPSCLLAVVGASGSGKSSLMRAGLVPALQRGEPLEGGTLPPEDSPGWCIHVISPTAHPLEALAISLTREVESVTAATTLVDDMTRDPRSLSMYIRKSLSPPSPGGRGAGVRGNRESRLLLVIDQFEELFTLCRSEAERTAFLDNLITSAGGPVLVVIVLRADFYAHCARYPQLRQALSVRQEYIGPMNAAELRLAIEEPARQGGWELEPGLVDLILRDVGASQGRSPEPGALPLLEHALLETWQRRSGKTLTLRGYAAAGGVHGAIARTADSVLNRLTAGQQALARRIFLRLTELGEDTGDGDLPSLDTRRRVALAELLPDSSEKRGVENLLNELAGARLITLAEGAAEVAHEALIREWPALRQWLSEDRESLRLHRRLTEAALAWQALDKDPGELYRGARLAQAVEWAAQAGHRDELNSLEQEFLAASQEFAQREAAEREAQRQRELDAARRATEAAQKLAETEQRAARGMRRRALGLALALAAAVLLLVATFWFARTASLNAQAVERERQKAVIQAQKSFASELSVAANANLDKDPELSILLAMQAISVTQSAGITDTWKFQQILHDALPRLRVSHNFPSVVGTPWNLAYSPDGKFLAFGDQSEPRGYTILDAETGEIRLRLPRGFASVAFSPDGKFLATSDSPDTVKVWEFSALSPGSGPVEGSAPQAALALSNVLTFSSIRFSPDGKWLAARVSRGLGLWEVSSLGQPFETDRAIPAPQLTLTYTHSYALTDFAFSPDGQWLASAASDDHPIELRNIQSGQSITLTSGSSKIAFSPDGKLLATDLGQVWDLTTRQKLFETQPTAAGWVSLAYNGRLLALGGVDGLITVVDGVTGKRLYDLAGHADQVVDLAFSPDGTCLASISPDRSIKIWDVSPGYAGELPSVPTGHSDMAINMEWWVGIPLSAKPLATLGADGKVILRDTNTLQVLDTFTITAQGLESWPQDPILFIDSNEDATRLAVSHRGGVTVWDIPNRKEAFTLPDLTYPYYTPDGRYLVAHEPFDAYVNKSIVLLDPLTGQRLMTFTNPASNIVWDDYSPDGKLAYGDSNGEIAIWDLSKGDPKDRGPLTRFQAYDPATLSIYFYWEIFSSDSKLLATLGLSNDNWLIKLWEVNSGQLLSTKTFPRRGYTDLVTFSPSLKFLVTCMEEDETILVWDTTSQAELLHLRAPYLKNCLDFTPDGERLIIRNSTDNTFEVFLFDRALVALAQSRLTRGWRPEECLTYLHRETCPAAPKP